MDNATLLKSVRIDDRRFYPDGTKIEVWVKGRNKHVVYYEDPKGQTPKNIIYYLNSEKISASLTENDIIDGVLSQIDKQTGNKYKVIQDPYSEKPPSNRIYGETPYYLNNGCVVNIKWMGKTPNPEFILGTFSNPDEAELYYQNSINRYISNKELTSKIDDANNPINLPMSSWYVDVATRDISSVESKLVSIKLPDSVKENDKSTLVYTESKEYPIQYDGSEFNVKPFLSTDKDSDIIKRIIETYKLQVSKLKSTNPNDYELKLCSPDTEYCSLIPYNSPLEPPKPNDTNKSTPSTDKPTKVNLVIQGLSENSAVFEIKAKTSMPDFTVWTGNIPQTEEIDIFDNTGLSAEYIEESFDGKIETI
jgi:hypothetical protein